MSLGVILIGAVLSLTYAMHKRLIAAQRDREEMVALRVFDELEREINAFLATENQRAPYQSFQQTNPELWAPFVVGYFKQDGGEEFVAADGATSENKRRMTWSLHQLSERMGRPASAAPVHVQAALPQAARATRDAAQTLMLRQDETKKKQEQLPSQDADSGSKIIDSLNRAPEQRKQQASPKSSAPSGKVDPFSDYAESF